MKMSSKGEKCALLCIFLFLINEEKLSQTNPQDWVKVPVPKPITVKEKTTVIAFDSYVPPLRDGRRGGELPSLSTWVQSKHHKEWG